MHNLELIIFILILFATIRYYNGNFDAGEINEKDREFQELSDKYGLFWASVIQIFNNITKFFKKIFTK